MKNYDCIVVGGGISGMSASALLALKGQNVLLVESSKRLGGLAQTICYHGTEVPVGAHHLSGSEKNGIMACLLKQLNISIETICVPVKQMDVNLDGTLYTIPLSVDGLEEFIHTEFPYEKKCGEFIEIFRRYCNYYLNNDKNELYIFFKETSRLSFENFLDKYFESHRLKRLLSFMGPMYGGLEFNDSAFSHLSLLISYYCGTCYINPSIKELVRQLSVCLEELHVDVLFNSRYESVIVDEKKVTGIYYRDLTTNGLIPVMAENIVLTIDPSKTFHDQFADYRVTKKIEKLQVGQTVIRMVGTASKVIDGIKSSDISYIGEGKSITLESNSEELPMFMLYYPEFKDEKIPEGKTTFVLTFLTNKLLNASSQELKNQIFSLLEIFLPDLYETIESCIVFPPNVYKALSGNDCGAAFGWKRNELTTMYTNTFAPYVNEIKNLYICGNWSTDFGIYGALRSSACVAEATHKIKQTV